MKDTTGQFKLKSKSLLQLNKYTCMLYIIGMLKNIFTILQIRSYWVEITMMLDWYLLKIPTTKLRLILHLPSDFLLWHMHICIRQENGQSRFAIYRKVFSWYLWAEERSQIDIVPYFFGTWQFSSKNLKLANTDVCWWNKTYKIGVQRQLW